jgi:hypothetical protein
MSANNMSSKEMYRTAPQILAPFDRQLKTWPDDDYLSALIHARRLDSWDSSVDGLRRYDANAPVRLA